MAQAAAAGLYTPSGEPVPGDAEAGDVSSGREEKGVQTQALRADDLSRPAGPGGCESRTPQVYCRLGAALVPVHCHR